MTFEAPDIGDRVPAAEAVVAQALAAFRAQDWEGVVALTDADSSEKLRRNYLRGKARRTQRSPPSWVGPDAVSEEIRELLKAMAELPVTFHELAAVTTLEEAEALSVTEGARPASVADRCAMSSVPASP